MEVNKRNFALLLNSLYLYLSRRVYERDLWEQLPGQIRRAVLSGAARMRAAGRAVCGHDLELLLIRAGIEQNPGPQSKGNSGFKKKRDFPPLPGKKGPLEVVRQKPKEPELQDGCVVVPYTVSDLDSAQVLAVSNLPKMAQKRQEECKRQKKLQKKATHKDQKLILQSMKETEQQEAGEQDAASEAGEEVEEKAPITVDSLDGPTHDLFTRPFWCLALPPEQFHKPQSFLEVPLDSLTTFANCAWTWQDLDRPALPHSLFQFTPRNPEIEAVLEDCRLPQHKSDKVRELPHHMLRYEVRTYRCGPFHAPPVPFGPVSAITLSLENFLDAASHRLYESGRLGVVFLRVTSFRACTSRGVAAPGYSIADKNFLSDVCYSCLLLLHAGRVPSAVTLTTVVDHEARCAVYRALSKDFPTVPVTSIIGYTASYVDVFKEALPEDILSRNSVCRVVHGREKQKDQYAQAIVAPVSIDGVLPCFPRDTQPESILKGASKRLTIKRLRPSPESARKLAAVCRDMYHDILKDDYYREIPEQEVLDQCHAHAMDKGFVGDDLRSYMAGAAGAFHLTPEVLTLIEQAEFKSFIKPQTYVMDARKGPRFIIAPDMFFRGFSHATLYAASHSITLAFAQWNVKCLARDQMIDKIVAKFDGLSPVFETDFTSMESNIQRPQIEYEFDCYRKYTPFSLQDSLLLIRNKMLKDTHISTKHYKLILEPMRLSGTEQTSIGNFLANFAWVNTMLRRCTGEQKPWHAFPMLFEGDDGLFHCPALPDSDQALKDLGVRMKLEEHSSVAEAHFCGATLAHVESKAEVEKPVPDPDVMAATAGVLEYSSSASGPNRRCILRDPLEVLGRVTSLLKPDLTSAKEYLQLQAAKVMSYSLTFPDLPLVGTFCSAFLARHREAVRCAVEDVQRIRSGLAPIHGPGQKMREIYQDLEIRHRVDDFIAKFSNWKNDAVTYSTPAVQAACEKLYGIPAEVSRLAETQIAQQIQQGITTLKIPALEAIAKLGKAASSMTTKTFLDARELAEQYEPGPKINEFVDTIKDAGAILKVVFNWILLTFTYFFPWYALVATAVLILLPTLVYLVLRLGVGHRAARTAAVLCACALFIPWVLFCVWPVIRAVAFVHRPIQMIRRTKNLPSRFRALMAGFSMARMVQAFRATGHMKEEVKERAETLRWGGSVAVPDLDAITNPVSSVTGLRVRAIAREIIGKPQPPKKDPSVAAATVAESSSVKPVRLPEPAPRPCSFPDLRAISKKFFASAKKDFESSTKSSGEAASSAAPPPPSQDQ